jgi:hypothetical protein
LRGGDGSLVFRRPDGRAVPSRPSPARGDCRELASRNREIGLRIGPKTALPLGRGVPFDRDLAVAGLLAKVGP